MIPSRFDVFLVSLDPTIGSEIKKTRPCVVVSPDETHPSLRTCLVAPLTSGRTYPWRVPSTFGGQGGCIAVDQMRCIDRERLVRHLGTLDAATQGALLAALGAFFAP